MRFLHSEEPHAFSTNYLPRSEFALTSRTHLKSHGQVQLHYVVIINGVESGYIQIVTAGAEFVVNLGSIAVANRANDCIRETVGKCRIKTLKVGTAFKKVGVQQGSHPRHTVRWLPIKPGLPGIFL